MFEMMLSPWISQFTFFTFSSFNVQNVVVNTIFSKKTKHLSRPSCHGRLGICIVPWSFSLLQGAANESTTSATVSLCGGGMGMGQHDWASWVSQHKRKRKTWEHNHGSSRKPSKNISTCLVDFPHIFYLILMECRTHMPRNPKTKSEDLAFPEIHMELLTNKIQPTNIDLCFHFRQPNWCWTSRKPTANAKQMTVVDCLGKLKMILLKITFLQFQILAADSAPTHVRTHSHQQQKLHSGHCLLAWKPCSSNIGIVQKPLQQTP